MRINLVAWLRFARLALKEVGIRLGFGKEQQKNIPAYARKDGATEEVLYQLEKTDRTLYINKKERQERFITAVDNAEDEGELNNLIMEVVD